MNAARNLVRTEAGTFFLDTLPKLVEIYREDPARAEIFAAIEITQIEHQAAKRARDQLRRCE